MIGAGAELAWIDAQADVMTERVRQLAQINSHSFNLPGVQQVAAVARDAFADLPDHVYAVDLPPVTQVDDTGQIIHRPLGQALHLIKRRDAPHQVLLAIHMDTVYPPDHPLQSTTVAGQIMRGPGVADAKGGLVVMLTALQAIEQCPGSEALGWHVILNPDEEIGSPGSVHLLRDVARQCHVGLVFEPALPDGSLADSRGGSGNFTLVIRGKAAHVGRAYQAGHSAVSALGQAIQQLESPTNAHAGLIVNVACVHAASPLNVVPALAIARFNVRFRQPEQQTKIHTHIHDVLTRLNQSHEATAQLHGGISAPIKPLDPPTSALLAAATDCAGDLGLTLHHRYTAGVCDGNRLAAAGLPTLDTLGVCGSGLHSDREQLVIPSLVQRAKLTALLLIRLTQGKIDWPAKNQGSP